MHRTLVELPALYEAQYRTGELHFSDHQLNEWSRHNHAMITLGRRAILEVWWSKDGRWLISAKDPNVRQWNLTAAAQLSKRVSNIKLQHFSHLCWHAQHPIPSVSLSADQVDWVGPVAATKLRIRSRGKWRCKAMQALGPKIHARAKVRHLDARVHQALFKVPLDIGSGRLDCDAWQNNHSFVCKNFVGSVVQSLKNKGKLELSGASQVIGSLVHLDADSELIVDKKSVFKAQQLVTTDRSSLRIKHHSQLLSDGPLVLSGCCVIAQSLLRAPLLRLNSSAELHAKNGANVDANLSGQGLIKATDTLFGAHRYTAENHADGFMRQLIKPDGDCAFTALGTTRQQFVAVLRRLSRDDPKYRQFCCSEIKEFMLIEDYFDNVLKQYFPERQNHMAQGELGEAFDAWCTSSAVFDRYLNVLQLSQLWAGMRTMRLYAHAQRIRLHFWEVVSTHHLKAVCEDQDVPLASLPAKGVPQRTLHLLWRDRSHFDVLVPTGSGSCDGSLDVGSSASWSDVNTESRFQRCQFNYRDDVALRLANGSQAVTVTTGSAQLSCSGVVANLTTVTRSTLLLKLAEGSSCTSADCKSEGTIQISCESKEDVNQPILEGAKIRCKTFWVEPRAPLQVKKSASQASSIEADLMQLDAETSFDQVAFNIKHLRVHNNANMNRCRLKISYFMDLIKSPSIGCKLQTEQCHMEIDQMGMRSAEWQSTSDYVYTKRVDWLQGATVSMSKTKMFFARDIFKQLEAAQRHQSTASEKSSPPEDDEDRIYQPFFLDGTLEIKRSIFSVQGGRSLMLGNLSVAEQSKVTWQSLCMFGSFELGPSGDKRHQFDTSALCMGELDVHGRLVIQNISSECNRVPSDRPQSSNDSKHLIQLGSVKLHQNLKWQQSSGCFVNHVDGFDLQGVQVGVNAKMSVENSCKGILRGVRLQTKAAYSHDKSSELSLQNYFISRYGAEVDFGQAVTHDKLKCLIVDGATSIKRNMEWQLPTESYYELGGTIKSKGEKSSQRYAWRVTADAIKEGPLADRDDTSAVKYTASQCIQINSIHHHLREQDCYEAPHTQIISVVNQLNGGIKPNANISGETSIFCDNVLLEQEGSLDADVIGLSGCYGYQGKNSRTTAQKQLSLFFDGGLEKAGTNASPVIVEAAPYIAHNGSDKAEIIKTYADFTSGSGIRAARHIDDVSMISMRLLPDLPNFFRWESFFHWQNGLMMARMIAVRCMPWLAVYDSLLPLLFLGLHTKQLVDDLSIAYSQQHLRQYQKVMLRCQAWTTCRRLWALGRGYWRMSENNKKMAKYLNAFGKPQPIPKEDVVPLTPDEQLSFDFNTELVNVRAFLFGEEGDQTAQTDGAVVTELPMPEADPQLVLDDPQVVDEPEKIDPTLWECTKQFLTKHGEDMSLFLLPLITSHHYSGPVAIHINVLPGLCRSDDHLLMGNLGVHAALNQVVVADVMINVGMLSGYRQILQAHCLIDTRHSYLLNQSGFIHVVRYHQHGGVSLRKTFGRIDDWWQEESSGTASLEKSLLLVEHAQLDGVHALHHSSIVGDVNSTGLLYQSGHSGFYGQETTQSGLLVQMQDEDGKPAHFRLHGEGLCRGNGHGDNPGHTIIWSGHVEDAMDHLIGCDRYNQSGGGRGVFHDQPIDLTGVEFQEACDHFVSGTHLQVGDLDNAGYDLYLGSTEGDVIESGHIKCKNLEVSSARLIKKERVTVTASGQAHECGRMGVMGSCFDHQAAGGPYVIGSSDGSVHLTGTRTDQFFTFLIFTIHTGCDVLPMQLIGQANDQSNGLGTVIYAPNGDVMLGHVHTKSDGTNLVMANRVLRYSDVYVYEDSYNDSGFFSSECGAQQYAEWYTNSMEGQRNLIITTDVYYGVGTQNKGGLEVVAPNGAQEVDLKYRLNYSYKYSSWFSSDERSGFDEHIIPAATTGGDLQIYSENGDVYLSDQFDVNWLAIYCPNGNAYVIHTLLEHNEKRYTNGVRITLPSWLIGDDPPDDPLVESFNALQESNNALEVMLNGLNLAMQGYNDVARVAKAYNKDVSASYHNKINPNDTVPDNHLKKTLIARSGLLAFGMQYDYENSKKSWQTKAPGGGKANYVHVKANNLSLINGAELSWGAAHFDVDKIFLMAAKCYNTEYKKSFSVGVQLDATEMLMGDGSVDGSVSAWLGGERADHQEGFYAPAKFSGAYVSFKDNCQINNHNSFQDYMAVDGKGVVVRLISAQDNVADSHLSGGLWYVPQSKVGDEEIAADFGISFSKSNVTQKSTNPKTMAHFIIHAPAEGSDLPPSDLTMTLDTQSGIFMLDSEHPTQSCQITQHTNRNNVDTVRGGGFSLQVSKSNLMELFGASDADANSSDFTSAQDAIPTIPVGIMMADYEAEICSLVQGVVPQNTIGDKVVTKPEDIVMVKRDRCYNLKIHIPLYDQDRIAYNNQQIRNAYYDIHARLFLPKATRDAYHMLKLIDGGAQYNAQLVDQLMLDILDQIPGNIELMAQIAQLETEIALKIQHGEIANAAQLQPYQQHLIGLLASHGIDPAGPQTNNPMEYEVRQARLAAISSASSSFDLKCGADGSLRVAPSQTFQDRLAHAQTVLGTLERWGNTANDSLQQFYHLTLDGLTDFSSSISVWSHSTFENEWVAHAVDSLAQMSLQMGAFSIGAMNGAGQVAGEMMAFVYCIGTDPYHTGVALGQGVVVMVVGTYDFFADHSPSEMSQMAVSGLRDAWSSFTSKPLLHQAANAGHAVGFVVALFVPIKIPKCPNALVAIKPWRGRVLGWLKTTNRPGKYGLANGYVLTTKTPMGLSLSKALQPLSKRPVMFAQIMLVRDQKLMLTILSHVPKARWYPRPTAAQNLLQHFEKHAASMAAALGDGAWTVQQYEHYAYQVLSHGRYVPERSAVVGFPTSHGGQLVAPMVGIDRGTGLITTFHVRSAPELANKAPSLGWVVNKNQQSAPKVAGRGMFKPSKRGGGPKPGARNARPVVRPETQAALYALHTAVPVGVPQISPGAFGVSVSSMFNQRLIRSNSLREAQGLLSDLKAIAMPPSPQSITNAQLKKLFFGKNALYRSGKVGNGSTAAAVRFERSTGGQVGGLTHTEKAENAVTALRRWLDANQTVSVGTTSIDMMEAELALRDLENALATPLRHAFSASPGAVFPPS